MDFANLKIISLQIETEVEMLISMKSYEIQRHYRSLIGFYLLRGPG